jgi:hypothetical protein
VKIKKKVEFPFAQMSNILVCHFLPTNDKPSVEVLHNNRIFGKIQQE